MSNFVNNKKKKTLKGTKTGDTSLFDRSSFKARNKKCWKSIIKNQYLRFK